MYCQKCGYKLKKGVYVCTNCGTDNEQIEYCGGYWGIVGDEEKIDKMRTKDEMSTADASGQSSKSKRSILTPVLIVLCIVMLAFSGVQTQKASKYSKAYQQVEKLKTENKKLKKQNKGYKKLKKEYAKLKEAEIQIDDDQQVDNQQVNEKEMDNQK